MSKIQLNMNEKRCSQCGFAAFFFLNFNRISAFIVLGVNVEVKWQAGHTGDHRMLLLVGEYPQSPLKR